MARKKPSRKTELPTFSNIDKMTFAELRSTYSNLRTIFNKRVGRAIEAGISSAKPYGPGGSREFPLIKDLFTSKAERGLSESDKMRGFAYNIKELINLLQGGVAQPISIKQVREEAKSRDEQMVKTLKSVGYEHIPKTTLKNFGRFMDAMRKQYGRKLPNSAEMVEFFDSLKYNTKRRSTEYIVNLWREFERNGYQSDNGNEDLFAT